MTPQLFNTKDYNKPEEFTAIEQAKKIIEMCDKPKYLDSIVNSASKDIIINAINSSKSFLDELEIPYNS